jgi:hypothetical protein
MGLVSEKITFYVMENWILTAKIYEVGRDSLFSVIMKQEKAFAVML